MAALQPGDHLVIASGVYREALLFPKRDWASGRPTIIEGSGTVQINGADIVTGWTALGHGTFYRHWEQEPSQVVVDDVQLQQIGGTVFDGYPTNAASAWAQQQTDDGGIWPGRKPGDVHTLPPDSFIFDAAAGRLYVRPKAGDLAGHVVQVSTRTFSAYGTDLTNITLKNLTFQLGNTSIASRAGLVTLKGNHLVLDHVTVDYADSVGIELAGDDNTMRHVVANRCGQLGIKARGERVSIIDSETDFNNTRGFNKWWEAGGAKFIGDGGLRNSIVSAHTAIGNFGDGIWFDWENQGNRVEKSLSEYNTGFGIQYEASSAGTIVDNIVVGNGQRGIYLPHSSASVVAYNLVAGNALQGIAVMDEGRLDPDGRLNLRPHANRIFANVVAWNGAALNLPAKLRDNTSDSNVYIDDSDVSQWNLGWQTSTADSLPDWTQRTGQDRHSVHIQRIMDPLFRTTLAEKKRMPDLTWYRTLRATLAPVPSGELLDARPGPAI